MKYFPLGQVKSPKAKITVPNPGISCTAELFVGVSDTNKAASSGQIAFNSVATGNDLTFPITLPNAPGTYHVYINVYLDGQYFKGFQASEDITILDVGIEFTGW